MKDAYTWIAEEYEKGAQIYLFGVSTSAVSLASG